MRCQVVGVILALVHVARAQPQYPESVADRPLTLLDGMTQLVVDAQLRSSTGHPFESWTPDIEVAHAFGPVELTADFGQNAVAQVTVQLPELPLAVRAGALSGAPQPNDTLHVAEFAAVLAKQTLVPGAVAIDGRMGVTRSDNRIRTVTDELVWTHVYNAYVEVDGELQLMPTLAVIGGLGFSAPFGAVGPAYDSAFGARCVVLLTVAHSWDLYTVFELDDLGDSRRPYLEAGFEKRWGG